MTKKETKQYFIDLYVEHIKQEDIPEWANWIATDADGEICVYEANTLTEGYGEYWDFISQSRYNIVTKIEPQTLWKDSLMTIRELWVHRQLQKQKGESVQYKIEFEAVSGDQSLFDLVGADSQDIVVVKLDNVKSILALREKSFGDNIIAERKVKEKPYIPEVGHTYKLSKEHSDIFACVFVDKDGVVWSTCDGNMIGHNSSFILSTDVKFIRVS